MKISFITLFTILISVSFCLNAQFYPDKPGAWVNDYADILPPEQEQRLNQKLSNYQDSTGTQIFIVSTNDHKGARFH
jgi:uncharacterized protein